MEPRREEEAEPNLRDGAFHGLGRAIQVEPTGRQHVRGARFAADGAVAVLGHRHARAGGDQRGRGGDVEARAAVAARAHHVRHGAQTHIDGNGMAKEKARCADEFAAGLALHAQGHEERPQADGLGFAAHDLVKDGAHLALGEVATRKGIRQGSVKFTHGGTPR